MKVLFVSSGNSHYGIIPFIKSQGESLKEVGIDLDYFPVIGKGIQGYLKNRKLLREQVKNQKYDLIHAHYGLIGFLCIISFLKTPIVLSIMGDDAYGSYDKNGRRRFSSIIPMIITQISMVFAKQLIVKSRNILSVVIQKNKTSIVPNGVNFSKFKPFNDTLVQNKILWLANPEDPRKNFQLVKDAVDIIGNSSIEVINPYPIKHKKFPKYLNECSVFVLTSYNEGSPNVIKESMACNIPIVSTNVGDAAEVIGKTEGCYISSFEPSDVAEKIKKALDFGRRTTGRTDIKHLESGAVASRILEIYKKALR